MIALIIFLSLFKPSYTSDICYHCRCDRHSATVTCTGYSILLRSVTVPIWADTLYFHHMSLRHLPHFAYSEHIKVLRINHCGLSHIHPLSLTSLPNLETVHLADNLLTDLPIECFFDLKKLRILNLARNMITDLSLISEILPPSHILDQLTLSGNPIQSSSETTRLPLARQLCLSDMNMQFINSSVIKFLPSSQCTRPRCHYLYISEQQWSILRNLDLSGQEELIVEPSLLRMITNVSTLNFDSARLPTSFPDWLRISSHVRHLNLGASVIPNTNREWKWCGEYVEWLDVSHMGLHTLTVESNCKVRFLKAIGNHLNEVILGASSLEAVFLEKNDLNKWILPPSGIILDQLQTLSLANNKIQYLPENALMYYPQLQHLDMSLNRIKNLSPNSFPPIGMQIRSLNISHNQLSSFIHPVLPSLLLLDLSYNELKSLDPNLLAGLPLLQHFYLRSNKEIFNECKYHDHCWLNSLKQLVNLIELDLSDCNLEDEPDLSSFQALRKLDLSRNRLHQLNGALLPASLFYLDVSLNRIQYVLNVSLIRASSLHELDISHNPLICDCTLTPLLPLLSNDTSYNSDAYYCFSGKWQYPLLNYIENVGTCIPSGLNWLPTVLNAACVIMASMVVVTLIVIIVSRRSSLRCKPFSFTYKPLSTNSQVVGL